MYLIKFNELEYLQIKPIIISIDLRDDITSYNVCFCAITYNSNPKKILNKKFSIIDTNDKLIYGINSKFQTLYFCRGDKKNTIENIKKEIKINYPEIYNNDSFRKNISNIDHICSFDEMFESIHIFISITPAKFFEQPINIKYEKFF